MARSQPHTEPITNKALVTKLESRLEVFRDTYTQLLYEASALVVDGQESVRLLGAAEGFKAEIDNIISMLKKVD